MLFICPNMQCRGDLNNMSPPLFLLQGFLFNKQQLMDCWHMWLTSLLYKNVLC